MRNKTICSVIALLLLAGAECFSQIDSVHYAIGFDFVEGIYQTFDEFKYNNPSIKMSNVTSIKPYPKGLEFINKKIKSIEYLDQKGMIKEINAKNIWGLSMRNKIYIRINNKLHMLVKIGTICYFIEDKTNPFPHLNKYNATGRNKPGYVGGDDIYFNIKRSYIFSMDSGKVLSFTADNFEDVIVNDFSLYDEFNQLGDTNDKSKFLFPYIDLYNDRNPIYFPSVAGNFGANKK